MLEPLAANAPGKIDEFITDELEAPFEGTKAGKEELTKNLLAQFPGIAATVMKATKTHDPDPPAP